jgi:PKD repeat protein
MKKLLFLPLAFFLFTTLHAQLFVDTAYTADQMIHAFFDSSGVSVSNVTYTGTPASIGFFEGSQSNIGLNAGLLITTGKAVNAVGPNDTESKGTAMNIPGSAWLDALLPPGTFAFTFDASVIEMDVVPTTDTLCFQYVFASEEYQEYVNSQFNDVFAFLVEGPGLPLGDSIWVAPDTSYVTDDSNCWTCVDTLIIQVDTICWPIPGTILDTCVVFTDTLTEWCTYDTTCVPGIDTVIYPGYYYFSPGGVNIAEIPGTNLPVSINSLNQFVNTQYFIPNDGGLTVQYDAFTTPLWAKLPVQSGQTYHVRIAIADVGDGVFDSGVFLGIQSLGGDSLLPAVPQFQGLAAPGSTEVQFQNASLWATQYAWDFGDGNTSTAKNPVHEYAQPGAYTVSLTAQNWCSSETFTQEVTVGLVSAQEPASVIFQVWPNPTSGVVTLDLKQATEAEVRLTTFDGRLVYSGFLTDGAAINLNGYGKGVFALQVVSGGKVYMQKVVNR